MNQSRWRLEEATLYNTLPRWKSDQYYLYSFRALWHMNALLNRCQKTSKAIRRRAAFDTDEKDVRHERCKDTITLTS